MCLTVPALLPPSTRIVSRLAGQPASTQAHTNQGGSDMTGSADLPRDGSQGADPGVENTGQYF